MRAHTHTLVLMQLDMFLMQEAGLLDALAAVLPGFLPGVLPI